MKQVGIAKIKIDNPALTCYVRRIKAWDKENQFQIQNDSFYAIYVEEKFLGASTMNYDPETSNVNILLINGMDHNKDIFENETTKKLANIALNDYNAKTVRFNNGKKLVMTK